MNLTLFIWKNIGRTHNPTINAYAIAECVEDAREELKLKYSSHRDFTDFIMTKEPTVYKQGDCWIQEVGPSY